MCITCESYYCIAGAIDMSALTGRVTSGSVDLLFKVTGSQFFKSNFGPIKGGTNPISCTQTCNLHAQTNNERTLVECQKLGHFDLLYWSKSPKSPNIGREWAFT